MIGLDPILDILEIGFWTGVLADEKPLSIILIAKVGDGKSEALKKSYKAPEIKETWREQRTKDGGTKKVRTQIVKQIGSVLYTVDTTPFILYSKYGEYLKSGQIKHIVIPDFLSILTKSKEAMPDTIRFYNSLIEEGICRIESRYSDFVTTMPVQIGLITAVSYEDYVQRSKSQNWGAMGFLSRVLQVSWKYKENTKSKIRHFTFLREYHKEKPFDLNFPAQPISIDLPEKYEKTIEQVVLKVKDPTDDTGARRQKQVQSFLMGRAARAGRTKVDDSDIHTMLDYSKFFNPECKAEL